MSSYSELAECLSDLFDQRINLDRMLESIIVTHNHPDHTKGVRAVIEKH